VRFKHYLNEQEVLIYDTLYGNPDDVIFALENMKPPTGEKIIILVSHLGVWAKSGLKEKREDVKPDDQGDESPDAENPDGQEEQPDDEDKKEQSVEKAQNKDGFGGFEDEDEDGEKKKEDEKKESEKVEETVVELEPEEPKIPVYVPWVESDFPERVPAEE
jgi:hypothetical protein